MLAVFAELGWGYDKEQMGGQSRVRLLQMQDGELYCLCRKIFTALLETCILLTNEVIASHHEYRLRSKLLSYCSATQGTTHSWDLMIKFCMHIHLLESPHGKYAFLHKENYLSRNKKWAERTNYGEKNPPPPFAIILAQKPRG